MEIIKKKEQRTITKNNNARAQLLFCSLNLLFGDVLVAVVVVVCLSSLVCLSHLLKEVFCYMSLIKGKVGEYYPRDLNRDI